MVNLSYLLVLCVIIVPIYLAFYKKIDWFKFFILLKTLHIFISTVLLQNVVIHNSTRILVSILYILCVRVLKSALSLLLIILNQNKNNSLTF